MELPKPYTPEEDKTVRECAFKGISARECAISLGRTKSSILSRANRLGISFKREVFYKIERPTNENKDKSKKKDFHLHITPVEKRPFRFFSNIPKPTNMPRYEQPEAARTPFGKPRSLINLEEHHCRWPCFESPKSGRQMFCCADRMAGKPYCVEHQALVYVKKYFAEAVV